MIRNLKKIMRDEEAVGMTCLSMCGGAIGSTMAVLSCSPLICLSVICQCLAPNPQGPSILEQLLAIIS